MLLIEVMSMEKKVWFEQNHWVVEFYDNFGNMVLRCGLTSEPDEETIKAFEKQAEEALALWEQLQNIGNLEFNP